MLVFDEFGRFRLMICLRNLVPVGLNLLNSLSVGPSRIIDGRFLVALKLLLLCALEADIDRLREMDRFELP